MTSIPGVPAGLPIVTILGTARPGNYTAMALELVNDELRGAGAEVTVIDPGGMSLAFPGEPETDDAQAMRAAVERAAGIVLATPEYHGSMSAMLKLVIENLGFPSVLSGKPIALLGVAAGRIGAIKSLEQLRSVSSHVGGVVLPGPVSVAGVRRVFDADGICLDGEVEKQIRGVARHLLDYIGQHVCPRIALEAMVRAGS